MKLLSRNVNQTNLHAYLIMELTCGLIIQALKYFEYLIHFFTYVNHFALGDIC